MDKDENVGISLKRQLIRLLQEKSLTAAELSRRSGVPKQTISDWLGGIAPRNLPALLRIAKVLETSIEHLIFAEQAWSSVSEKLSTPMGMDTEIFGKELVMISENDLVRFMSPALLRILGDQDHSIQGRPIYEFVHIDDIPSMLDSHNISPHCFRMAGLHGHTRMTVHKAMPLGESGIVIHHLSPIMPGELVQQPATDFFDVRELVDASVQILRRNQKSGAVSYRVTYGTQPVYACTLRPLLGRLLLATLHDVNRAQGHGGASSSSYEEIGIEVDGDDKEFHIRFHGQAHAPTQRMGALMDLVQACEVRLKAWTTEASRIIEIQGRRIFLGSGLSQETSQNRQIYRRRPTEN